MLRLAAFPFCSYISSMKRAVLIAALLAATPAKADNITGNMLLDACTAPNDLAKAGFCTGYVLALNEGLRFGVAYAAITAGIQPENASDLNQFSEGILRYCLFGTVEIGQMSDVIVKYLQEHPETRHETARYLSLTALQEAFPCQ